MRPKVEIGSASLSENADGIWEALLAAPADTIPEVMVRGNELVRWTERGELEQFDPHSLADAVSRLCDCWRTNKDGEPEGIDPPDRVMKVLLKRDTRHYVGGPIVDSVVDTPVLGRTGRVISEPGHHADDRLLYVPSGQVKKVHIDPVESSTQVIMARDLLLDDLFGDFGFADESSKANALALLLTPFVREYIGDHPTPLFLIVAPEVGTGKSLLAQAALTPACGVVPFSVEATSEEEQRKRITATLLSGARAVVIDNITGGITSNVLAGAITSGVWTDRMLGESKQLVLPVRNVWVGTGNNLDLTDDNMRRVVPIILEPGDVRPSDRPKEKFKHEDLLGWARTKRHWLVQAALELVQHWVEGEALETTSGFTRESHRRERPDRTLGSFERWGEVVGGILAAADVKGFLENRQHVGNFNNDREETCDFIKAWQALGLDPVTTSELLALCSYGGELQPLLPESLQTDGRLTARQLGTWLRGKRGARFDGLRVERNRQRRTWMVVA